MPRGRAPTGGAVSLARPRPLPRGFAVGSTPPAALLMVIPGGKFWSLVPPAGRLMGVNLVPAIPPGVAPGSGVEPTIWGSRPVRR